jgi:hypothetical protein
VVSYEGVKNALDRGEGCIDREREDEHAVFACCAVESSAEGFCGRRKTSRRFCCLCWVEPNGHVAASLFDDLTPRLLIDLENVTHSQTERHGRWNLQAIAPAAERSDRQLLLVCATNFNRDENVMARRAWEASPA